MPHEWAGHTTNLYHQSSFFILNVHFNHQSFATLKMKLDPASALLERWHLSPSPFAPLIPTNNTGHHSTSPPLFR